MINFFPESILWGCLLIFCLRLFDVTLSVLRTILTVKGRQVLAGVIGFFEVTVFVIAISQVLANLDTIYHVLAYSGGFACGTVLGGTIEKWLAMGHVLVSVHCLRDWRLVAGELRSEGFGVTEYEAVGKDGPVHVVDSLVPRKEFPLAMQVIQAVVPEAFVHTTEQQFIFQAFHRRIKSK